MPHLRAPLDEALDKALGQALLAPLDDRADDVPAVVRPRLGAVLRRVSVSLLVACVVPAVLFYACFRLTDVWVAMAAALGWSYGAILWRVVTRRRPSGLLFLTAAVMTVRTLVSVALDSTYLYFLQPIVTDAAIATLFLASLATTRPVVARLAGDFYPLDDELALRPGVRRLFWRLTLLWGTIGAAKAAGTLWLLESQPLDTFVLVKTVTAPTLNGLTVAATIAAAVVVARREGLLERVVRPTPAGA